MRGTGWRGWRWLDRILLPLSIAGSYAAWVYPVLIAHVSDPDVQARYTGVAFWLCLGTLLAARLLGLLNELTSWLRPFCRSWCRFERFGAAPAPFTRLPAAA